MASDLSQVIALNNSQAMSVKNKLTSVDKVHIFAIVANQGGAGIKSGDFIGETLNIAVDNQESIRLIINNLVE